MLAKSFEVPFLRPLVKVDSPVCLATELEINNDTIAQHYSACDCECVCPCPCQCVCPCPCQCLCPNVTSLHPMSAISCSLEENKSQYLAELGKEAIRNSKLVIKPNLMLRKEESFGLVFDPKNFAEYKANLTAFEILSAISQGKSVTEAVQTIQEHYRQVPNNISMIVDTFIGQLIKCKGIVVQV